MNKLLPILLAATVYLTPLYPVYAQDDTTSSDTALNAPLRPGKVATSPAGIRPAVKEMIKENMREKVASRTAAFKAKLGQFKDKNKALRAETVNQNLENINTKATTHFQEVLDKISKTLERLKTRVTEAETNGKDVTAIKEAISKVEKEWTEADAAVKAQADQDYSIVVNTEKTIKTDAMATRNDLRQDLIATHTQVIEVRQALANAISTALSSVLGGK